MITKIKAKYLIGCLDDEHVIYQDGEVVFEEDEIIFVGQGYQGEFDEFIDAGNSIVSPGFIDLDALGDIDHALISNELPREKRPYIYWSEEYFDSDRKEWMSPEEEAFKSLYAYSQLIMHGVTTAMPITSVNYKKCAETYEEIIAAAHNAGRLGLRVYLGPSYVSGMHVIDNKGEMKVKWMEEEGRAGLERAINFIDSFHGAYDGLINGVLVPERIELQTEEILKKSKEYARKYNCPIRLHAAQGEFEYNTIQKKYGMSTISYLNSIDFLDEKTLIPHVIYASGYSGLEDQSEDDLDILRRTGSTVIHCPLVYSRSGTALESFGKYLRKGLNLSMGTDTFPPDMIRNFAMGSALARHIDQDRPENDFKEFYRAATIGGADALGRPDLGRIKPGAKADIIIVSLDGYHMGTVDDPLRTLCLSGSGSDVRTVIINGRTVMKDRIIPGFDYEEAQLKAQKYYEKLKRSYYERSSIQGSFEDLFQGSFRVIK